ncbi:MAG TPA: DUF6298 domain-containing protein [Terracidiphilus sp.]|nr:DUF6298 domain-containing protein [Terracidiphilus sp.]
MRLLAAAILVAALANTHDSAQTRGNPVGIDFSYAGFEGGGHDLPRVPVIISVRSSGGDDTALLQSALDHVASLPLRANGFRGAVLLRTGRFHINGQLHLNVSGVVLRGSGTGAQGTVLVAEGHGRRTLIEVGGCEEPVLGATVPITDDTVPAGSRTLHIADTTGLVAGSRVVVRRASTAQWIKAHGMNGLLETFADQRLDWKAGSHDLIWDRTITAIDPASKTVELDAPITFIMQRPEGPGTVAAVQSNAPIQNVGIENLALESAWDKSNPKDEEHSWIAIAMDHVEDAWVRNVAATHFVASAVRVGRRARRITVENCSYLAPISEVAGYRRQAFVVYGQQVLVYHCHSEYGMNDFATGLLAAGPNVFLDCDAKHSIEPSGTFEGLASGVLYENLSVPDSRIQLLLDPTRAQAAGWTAVNSVIWNSKAESLDALGPYDGPNYVVQSDKPLYQTELAARSLHLSAVAQMPAEAGSTPDFHEITTPRDTPLPQHPSQIVNGYFVIDGEVVFGGTQSDALWHGNTSPLNASVGAGSSITRFMPGQTAPGLTEDLHELVQRALKHGSAFYLSYPGLWYDRRRDGHTVFQMQNGDVWAPFFEMPWVRSGKGFAWDGLSRFDLSRYNPWYFDRHREFDRIAGEHGLIVLHQLYDTHNVLEIGPHWIDYPWRPANNINDTGIPEPPPFAPGYTLAMDTVQPTVTKLNLANEFYSVEYLPLRKLHHDYIFHVLDQFGDMPDVVLGVATQYAGPLSFEQFFQDTVAEWEKLHNRTVHIELAADKRITDTILNDPVRSRQVVAIDIRYWYYLADGTLYAPEAGKNRAYRDYFTAQFGEPYTNNGPATTPSQEYRLVREYRDRYPNLVILAYENGAGPIPVLMGGGIPEGQTRTGNSASTEELSTDAVIDKFVHHYLAHDLMKMRPVDGLFSDPTHNWVLAGDQTDAILIYSRPQADIQITRTLPRSSYQGSWIDPVTGELEKAVTVQGQAGTSIEKPDGRGWFLLLRSSSRN